MKVEEDGSLVPHNPNQTFHEGLMSERNCKVEWKFTGNSQASEGQRLTVEFWAHLEL